ncbi:MAG: hypothetical protein IJ515_04015 [Clostridia bacterium]|nr:hypothetical protein [Clostridia bacterium]
MIKAAGICILIFTLLYISSETVRKKNDALLLCEEFYRFLSHMRLQISCYLRPADELYLGFESKALDDIGFIGALKDGCSIGEAYKKAARKISLPTEVDRVLLSLFSSLGGSYLEEEIKLIDSHREELSVLLEREREESPKRAKMIRTLSVAISLGIIIFVI